jgi:hypothetical protein
MCSQKTFLSSPAMVSISCFRKESFILFSELVEGSGLELELKEPYKIFNGLPLDEVPVLMKHCQRVLHLVIDLFSVLPSFRNSILTYSSTLSWRLEGPMKVCCVHLPGRWHFSSRSRILGVSVGAQFRCSGFCFTDAGGWGWTGYPWSYFGQVSSEHSVTSHSHGVDQHTPSCSLIYLTLAQCGGHV